MSASVYWEPVVPQNKHSVNTDRPSWFGRVMAERFGGRPPYRLDAGDLQWLCGLRDSQPDAQEGNREAEELIAAIEEHGQIELTWEY